MPKLTIRSLEDRINTAFKRAFHLFPEFIKIKKERKLLEYFLR